MLQSSYSDVDLNVDQMMLCRISRPLPESSSLSTDLAAADPSDDCHKAADIVDNFAEQRGSLKSCCSSTLGNCTFFTSSSESVQKWSICGSLGFDGGQAEKLVRSSNREKDQTAAEGFKADLPTRNISLTPSSSHSRSVQMLSQELLRNAATTTGIEKDRQSHNLKQVWCEFLGKDGAKEVGLVEVAHAPIKTIARMREKLGEGWCPPICTHDGTHMLTLEHSVISFFVNQQLESTEEFH